MWKLIINVLLNSEDFKLTFTRTVTETYINLLQDNDSMNYLRVG